MEITCPRCGSTTETEYYGPCDGCRTELRATQRAEGTADGATVEYEPKMNVTPNAVALKDD